MKIPEKTRFDATSRMNRLQTTRDTKESLIKHTNGGMWKKAKTPSIAKTLKHNNEECPGSGNLKPGLGDCILGGPWPWKRQPPGPQEAKQLEQAIWQSLQKKGDRVSAKVSRKKTKPTGGRSTADGQKQQYAEHRYPCELTVWYTESIYKVSSQNRDISISLD